MRIRYAQIVVQKRLRFGEEVQMEQWNASKRFVFR